MQKRVLVTGSSRGIGAAIAQRLAKDGFEIIVHFRKDLDAAQQVCRQIEALKVKSKILQFDVCDSAAARSAIEQDMQENGAYYGVVSNAGIKADGPFPGLSEQDWRSVIDTNLNSFYNVLHPVILPMIRMRSGGRIVAISSYSGVIGNRGQSNYSAAKAGVIAASKSLAKELAKRAITVNCVAPGLIETDLTNNTDLSDLVKFIPMQRAGRPDEVASLVSYLMSEESSYITGEVISVSGGLV